VACMHAPCMSSTAGAARSSAILTCSCSAVSYMRGMLSRDKTLIPRLIEDTASYQERI
jgi:hypothetical protein